MTSSVLETAQLDWRNANTPVSESYDDVYFSADNGAAESDYVFLQHNNLAERFSRLQQNHFTIAETGFGTGLNFLQSWQLWRQHRKPGQKLYFISTECFPLTADDLAKSLACWPQFNDLSQQLCAQYPLPIRGMHTLELEDGVTLILLLDDALNGFRQLLENHHPDLAYDPLRAVDAWFLDGFAPAKNPDMWRDELFQSMAKLSHRDTSFASFTAAGVVRRGLKAAGFTVKKVPGFGRKREMIQGQYVGLPRIETDSQPTIKTRKYAPFWPIIRHTQKPESVVIIGAGIAGCTTAQTLAEAGLNVTLLDKHAQPMQNASGNPQGVLFPKLSHQATPFSEFNLFSLLYAQRYYRQPLFDQAFNASGMLQLLKAHEHAAAEKLCQRFSGLSQLLSFISAEQASQIAGTRIENAALWYPSTGWFKPDAIREAFMQHEGIAFHGDHPVDALEYDEKSQQWLVVTATQSFSADAVVISNASAARQLLPDHDLAIKDIRGQITRFDTQEFPTLKTVVCHDGYICPPDNQLKQYTCGASYELNDSNADLTTASQDYNIDTLNKYLPDFSALKAGVPLQGRVAFRCATADYLPLVGPVADKDTFMQHYVNYSKNAKAFIPQPGHYLPQLYLNVGYGSRGFSSAPVCAALLRAYMLRQPYPLPFDVARVLAPARFLIRDITRSH